MPDYNLGIVLTAKDAVSSVVMGLRGQFARFGAEMRTGFGIGAGLGVFGLVSGAVHDLTAAFTDSLGIAKEEEAAQTRLATALKDNVDGWNGNTDAINTAIDARRRLGFTDKDQLDSLNLLVTKTHDQDEALRLEGDAMDLARFKQISLSDASNLVGKAYTGQVTALRRAGLAIAQHATAAEALAALELQTAGHAEAFSKTLEGEQAGFDAQIEHLQSNLGHFLLGPATNLLDWMNSIIGGQAGTTDAVSAITDKLNGLSDAAAKTAPKIDTVAKSFFDFEANIQASSEYLNAGGQDLLAWYRQLEPAGKAAGTTAQNLWDLVKATKAHNQTLEWARGQLRLVTETMKDAHQPVASFGTNFKGAATDVHQATDDITTDVLGLSDTLVSALGQAESGVTKAMAQLTWAIRHPLALAAERAKLEGLLVGKDLVLGLASSDPVVRDAAERARMLIMAELDKLDEAAYTEGQRIGASLTSGITDIRFLGGHLDPKALLQLGGEPPAKATGGPVSAGGAYLVGERGPEILQMGSQGGHIYPNLGSGGDIVVNVDGERLFRIMNRRMGVELASVGASNRN